MKGVR